MMGQTGVYLFLLTTANNTGTAIYYPGIVLRHGLSRRGPASFYADSAYELSSANGLCNTQDVKLTGGILP